MMSRRSVAGQLLLQGASLLSLALAVASLCTTNENFISGRVTECHKSDNCVFGVCWGRHLDDHRNLTVNLTDEVRFTCNDPGLTLWLLPSEEDYDSCTAGVGAERLTECPEAGGEYSLYIVADNVQNTVQSNFVRVSSGQTEVYVASLSSNGTSPGECASGAKMVIRVHQAPGTSTEAPVGGGDDDDDGPGSSEGPIATDSPTIGELGGSNSGEVLGCSLLPLLAAALLSAISLWF